MGKHKWPDLPAIALFFGMVGLALVMTFLPQNSSSFDEGAGQPIERGIDRLSLKLGDFELSDIREQPRDTEFVGSEISLNFRGEKYDFSDVILKGRGNSTWNQPKSPLVMKLNEKIDLFDKGKSRKWLLLANYLDDSNLRNHIGLKAAEILGMNYAIKGDFVEVFVNGEYSGLYYLTDKVEISKERIDLREPLGILMERRDDVREDSSDTCYSARYEQCFVVKDVVSKDNTVASAHDFVKAFEKFEGALDSWDYEAIKKTIDVESFAKYYLLSELTVNPDAYIVSEYFYKDGVTDVIHMGPGWDFDYALANRRWTWAEDEEFYSPTALNQNVPEDGFIAKLLEMPEFQLEVRNVYAKTFAKSKDDLYHFAEHEAMRIYLVATINNIVWGQQDYEASARELISWLKERLKYLDEVFGQVVE